MDYQRPPRVSVLDPVEQAIGHIRQMLFTPFDLSKWFVIGFCAWLAYLGQGGWPHFNFNFNDGRHPFGPDGPALPAIKETVITPACDFHRGGDPHTHYDNHQLNPVLAAKQGTVHVCSLHRRQRRRGRRPLEEILAPW